MPIYPAPSLAMRGAICWIAVRAVHPVALPVGLQRHAAGPGRVGQVGVTPELLGARRRVGLCGTPARGIAPGVPQPVKAEAGDLHGTPAREAVRDLLADPLAEAVTVLSAGGMLLIDRKILRRHAFSAVGHPDGIDARSKD